MRAKSTLDVTVGRKRAVLADGSTRCSFAFALATLTVWWLFAAASATAADQDADSLPVEARKPAIHAPDLEPGKRASIEELTARVRKSVVEVRYFGRGGAREGLGTGFVISSDGLIATNLHVIGEARPIQVRTPDGKKYDVEEIHATERFMDLAVLRIKAKGLVPLPVGDSDTLKQGQSVIAVGNPQGLRQSVVGGVVSGTREIDGRPMIQLAMPIEPGNSGGPLIDMQGRVRGILTLKSRVTDNLGFAVAINALKPLLETPNSIPMSRWLTIGALDSREWLTLFGASWRQRAGRIRVSERGRGFGGRSLCLSKTPPPELPFEAAVWVRLKSEDGAAGIAFHADGDNLHYGFYPSNGKLRLSRFDGPDVHSWNVLREIRSKSYRSGEWNHLKVRISDAGIQCFVNDELVVESADSRYTSGKVGLVKFRDTQAEFKGFLVAKEIPSSRPPTETVERISELVADIATDRPPAASLVDALSTETESGPVVLKERARRLEQQAQRLRQLAKAVHEKKTRARLIELLSKEEKEIDLLHAALLIAGIDNSELDVDSYLGEIDIMVSDLSDKFDQDVDADTRLSALNVYLFEERGFHGSRNDYYNKSNSYLNEVLDDREGLPITLSVLYMELARRIGLDVVGVGLPGHFVVRFQPSEGESRILDPFDKGRVLTPDAARAKVLAIKGRALSETDLAPQTKKAILLRMLSNLMNIARESADTDGVLRYVETMVTIRPDDAGFRWFRAVLWYQTDRIEEAIKETDWIIEQNPGGIDMTRVHHLRRILDESRP